MRRHTLCAVTCISIIAGSQAAAAFNNGIETFNGASKDAATWSEIFWHDRPGGTSAVTQNDALHVQLSDGQGWQYTAGATPINVGQGVRAKVMVTSRNHLANSDQDNQLTVALGTADAIYGVTTGPGSRYYGLRTGFFSEDDPFGSLNLISGQGPGLHLFPHTTPLLNHTYVVEIDRLAANSISYSVSELDGTMIASATLSTTTYSASLYPSLNAQGVDAVVDMVQVVPEANTVLIASIASLVLVPLRNRGDCRSLLRRR